MELIRNKLMPPLYIPRVSRTRLLDLIERSRSAASATILTGRSGVGKTILAADYVRKSAAAVASARATMLANGIDHRVEVARDDALAARPSSSASLIALNPPFLLPANIA